MKLITAHITTLLMTAFILFVGSLGCQQQNITDEKAESEKNGADITDGRTPPTEILDSEVIPTTYYPPENPYEDLTATGTAPPPDYQDDPIFWIPDFDYEWEIEDTPAEYNDMVPIAPNHAEKWARYEQREYEYRDKLKKRIEGVTSEKRRGDIIREIESELADKRAEIMTEGMTPLNAVKYIAAHNIYTDRDLKYAQQALDDNPDDYHTLLVWTRFQRNYDKKRDGYWRLLKMRPNAPYALYRLGDITYSAEAIPLLKKAYQYAPDVPADHPTFLKTGILFELAKAYFYWTEEDAKALETLKHLSKYGPEGAEYHIMTMQRDNKIGKIGRPKKEKTNE